MLAFALALLQAAGAAQKPLAELPPLAPYRTIAFSPDHSRIALQTVGAGVWILDCPTGVLRAQLPPARCFDSNIAWSTDGELIALLQVDGVLAVVEAQTGAIRKLIQTERPPASCEKPRILGFVARNSRLVLSGGCSATEVWDITSGRKQGVIASAGSATAIAWSRDGELIAVGSTDRSVTIWTACDLTRKATYGLPSDNTGLPAVQCLDFNADGTVVAIAAPGCFVRLWKFGSGHDVKQLECTSMFGELACSVVQYSRDGKSLLTVTFPSYEAWVWDSLSLSGRRAIDRCGGAPFPLKGWISSDGKYVAMGSGWPVTKVPEPGVKVECDENRPATYFQSDGDYAWAVVNHELIVRKVPDEEPVVRVAVREK